MSTMWGGQSKHAARREVLSAVLAGAAIACLALAGLAFKHSLALGVFGVVLCLVFAIAAEATGRAVPQRVEDAEVEVVDEHGQRLPAKLLPPRRPVRVAPGVYRSRQTGGPR